MNLLTYDIEEWYLEKEFYGNRKEKYQEYERYLRSIIELLDETDTKATFFCLGKIATEFPEVVKLISNKGHEIGCHSNTHAWLNKLTYEQVKEDTHAAISALEDVCGSKVKSYRAPAFSIGESNKWALEILASEGIERDASIFPAVRDFGGFPNCLIETPSIISYNGIEIKEFPIPLTTVLGRELAYSGGGYFRLFPYSYIRKKIQKSDYAMTYFHIEDLIDTRGSFMSKKEYEEYFKEPGTLKNRLSRYIKSNVGTGGAFDKMSRLIRCADFHSLAEMDERISWDKVDKVEL